MDATAEDTAADVIGALAARLDRLETAEAAREAVHRYVAGLDARDWDLVASALDADAVMPAPDGELRGREAIVASLQQALEVPFTPCHQITNARVDVTGPGAAVVTATIQYTMVGGGADAVGWGVYRDEVRVTDGVGRIFRKEFTPAQHLAGSITSLGARLEQLETAELARAVGQRYAQAVDTVDLDLLEQCFTEDAVLTTRSGTRRGRAEILAYYRGALAGPVARRHFLTNPSVTSTGPGEAAVETYLLYTFAGDDTSIVGWGTYRDRVLVVDGVGYLAEREIEIDAHADSRVGWASEADGDA